jgi:hypothetical protein
MSADQLKMLTDKIQELVKRHDLLKKENDRLRAELLPAKEREMGLLEQIASLEQRVMVLKAGAGNLSETDKKELDRKIHVYLKEIDKCITMLGE